MYNRPLVRPDFVVPGRVLLDGVKLCMLSVEGVEREFEALFASETWLKGLSDRESPLPEGKTPNGLSFEALIAVGHVQDQSLK